MTANTAVTFLWIATSHMVPLNFRINAESIIMESSKENTCRVRVFVAMLWVYVSVKEFDGLSMETDAEVLYGVRETVTEVDKLNETVAEDCIVSVARDSVRVSVSLSVKVASCVNVTYVLDSDAEAVTVADVDLTELAVLERLPESAHVGVVDSVGESDVDEEAVRVNEFVAVASTVGE